MITPNQVHVDQALAQISVAYENPDFVFQSEVFPVVPVDKQSDVFFKFSKQHFRAVPDSKRPGADVNTIALDLDARGNYQCDGHALDLPTPDEVASNADPGADLDIETTLKVTEMVRLNEEILGAAKINTTNITQSTTLSGTSQWTDFANSDPFLAIDTQKTTIRQSTGLDPSKFQLLISEYGYLKLRNHPKVIDRVKYTQTGGHTPLNPEQLANALGVAKLVVGAAIRQTGTGVVGDIGEGAADALSYIWGKHALLYYKPPRPGKRTAALGYTFVWMVSVNAQGKMIGNLVSNTGGFLVRRYRWERRRADVIGVEYYYDQHYIDANAGYYWLNAFA